MPRNNKNNKKITNVKGVRTIVKEDKAILNQLSALNKKMNKGRLTANAKRKRAKFKQGGRQYPNFVRDYVFAVCNPIHTMSSPRIPDYFNHNTISLFDEFIADENLTISINRNVVETFQAALFYVTYGPVYADQGVDQPNIYAWQIWIIPIDGNGQPMVDVVANQTYVQPTVNYTSIWDISVGARMVTYGFRINSLIDMATDSSDQFLAILYSFQYQFADFKSWLGGGTNITNYIVNLTDGYGRYNNQQGASARFDSVQDQYLLFKMYDRDFLEAGQANNEVFSSDTMRFPAIYVRFQQPISTALTMLSGQNKKKVVIDKSELNLLKNNIKGMDELITNCESSPFDHIINDDKLCQKDEKKEDEEILTFRRTSKGLEQIGLSVPAPYTFILPLKFEARFFVEAVLAVPTSLRPSPSPVYPKFDNIIMLTNNKNICPYWSDGHSFKNVMKWLSKNITPKNVTRAGNYTAGMIRAGTGAYTNIMNAYRGGASGL